MKHRKWTKILLAAGCCVCAAGAGVMNLATAEAEELQGVDVSSFMVSETAAARFVPGSTDQTGIRFTASMDKTAYENLEKLEETQGVAVNYGMLIVPKDYIESTSAGKGAVTEESVFGQDAVYCVEDKTTEHLATCTKTHIARATADELTCESQTVGEVNVEKAVLRGSIVKLKTENVHREFVGVAYIEYRSGSVTDYVFATANNARSMTYIAQRAIEDDLDDATGTLYNTYVKPLEDAEFKYTVEHWLPTGEDTYELAKTEEKWGKINEQVSASNIAKTDSTYGEWATAKMNEGNDAKVSDIVYVNGKTVLKCYYKQVNTTLFSAEAGADSDEVKLMCSTNTDEGSFARAQSSAELVDDTVDGVSKKVLKVTSVDKDTNRDTVLDLQLLQDRLQDAADANWDYITIKMKITAQASLSGVYADAGITAETIDPDSDSYNEAAADAFATEQTWINKQTTVELSNGTMRLGSYPVNEWVDVVIPKALLNTAHTKNSAGTAWNYYSEYVGNKDNLTMENPAKTDLLFDTLFSKHGVGETTIRDNFLTTFTYWNKTFADLASFNNDKWGRAHDVEITCYVDSITWGVDYKAPTIKNVETEACITEAGSTTVTFIPDYEVEDDILPQASDVSPCLIKSEANIYEVVDGTYTLQTADENGVYVLDKNKTYKLRISAWDWSVSDIDGNKRTEEYDISIVDLTQNTLDFSSESDMEYVSTSLNYITATKVFHEEWTGGRDSTTKNGVMQLNTSLSGVDKDGAGFVLNYNSAKAQKILDEYYTALADESVDFELKITILFEFGNVGVYGDKSDEKVSVTAFMTDGTSKEKSESAVTDTYVTDYDASTKTYSGGGGILINVGGKNLCGSQGLELAETYSVYSAWDESKKMRDGVWYTLTFTEEILSNYCGWTNDAAGEAQALMELSGECALFNFSGNMVVNGNNATNGFNAMPVTYFIDEISYDTTSVEAAE